MNIKPFLAVAAMLLSVAACSGPAEAPPLAGASIGGPFSLTDQSGRTVTDRDFAGRYRIVYFGFTYCPDVCPTGMQVIGAGLSALEKSDPDLAAKVVPIFVSVDPARDTPAVVKEFVSAFHPRFVGLTGSPEAIAAMTKAYGVYAEKAGDADAGSYLVNHSDTALLFGPEGEPLAILPHDQGPAALAAEIERWAR